MMDRDIKNEYPNGFPFIEAFKQAFSSLLENDRRLLNINANERTISQRLAHYLQNRIPHYNIDCEYNRDESAQDYIKRIGISPEAVDSSDLRGKTIYPDILVHKRGVEGPNIVVIEIKKNATPEEVEKDLNKLKLIKSKFRYEYGLFINFDLEIKSNLELIWV